MSADTSRLQNVTLIDETARGKDRTYDMAIARRYETWQALSRELSQLHQGDVLSPDSAERAEIIIRFCQISCAHGTEIQNLAIRSAIHEHMAKYARSHPRLTYSALSNMITGNCEAASIVLESSLKPATSVTSLVQDDVLALDLPSTAILFLRNALAFTLDERHHSICKLIASSDLLLIELGRTTFLQQSLFCASNEEDDSLRFSLLVAIFDTLLQARLLSDVLSNTRHLGGHKLHAMGAKNEVYRYVDQYCFQDKLQPGDGVPSVIVAQLDSEIGELQGFLAATGVDKEMQQTWIGTSLLISSLSALLTHDSGEELLVDPDVQSCVPSVVKALGLAHQHFPRSKGGRRTGDGGTSIVDIVAGFELPNLKRDCITILSNLTHRNRALQDLVRDLDGIPLILAQCNIDDLNPYLREHAMYCIRNLLEDNKANQDVVDAIKPVGVQQTDELSDLGYQAEFTDGKIALQSNHKIHSINEE